MSTTYFNPPYAAYSNPPINPQYYEPSQFYISNITIGSTTLVQTTVNHNYVIGQLCRLIITPQNGCRQLNEASGYVIEIPEPNQVILNIDSSQNVDSFKTSSASNQPQILAIGDVNTGTINSTRNNTGTYVPGSFINISPI